MRKYLLFVVVALYVLPMGYLFPYLRHRAVGIIIYVIERSSLFP